MLHGGEDFIAARIFARLSALRSKLWLTEKCLALETQMFVAVELLSANGYLSNMATGFLVLMATFRSYP